MTILSGLVKAADWYAARMKTFMKAMPVVMEMGEVMADHNQFLEGYTEQQAETDEKQTVLTDRLTKVHDDLSKVLSSVEQDMMATFIKATIDITVKHMDTILVTATGDEIMSSAWWNAAQALVTAASLSFPMDKRVQAWQVRLGELMMEKGEDAKRVNLMEEVFSMAKKSSMCAEDISKLIPMCKQCSDLTVPDDLVKTVKTAIERTILAMLEGIEDKEFTDMGFELLPELLRFVVKPSPWHTLHNDLETAVRVKMHMPKLKVVALDGQAWADKLVFRRDLAALQKVVTRDLVVVGVSANVLNNFRTFAKEVYKVCDIDNVAMLAKENGEAKQIYEEAEKSLALVAYGSAKKVAWDKAAKATIKLPDLITMAKETGLMEETMRSNIASKNVTFQAARLSFLECRQVAGEIVPEEWIRTSDALAHRANLSIVQGTLLQMAAKAGLDKDDARPKLKAEISKLRSMGMKEKLVLQDSLYKWVFNIVAGK